MMQHLNITIIQLMSVILLTGSTSKASKKKRVTFFITFTNVFFIFRIKNAFFNVFNFFLTFITTMLVTVGNAN